MNYVCEGCIHRKVCSLGNEANLFTKKVKSMMSVIPDASYEELFGVNCEKFVHFSLITSIECGCKITADGLKTEVEK